MLLSGDSSGWHQATGVAHHLLFPVGGGSTGFFANADRTDMFLSGALQVFDSRDMKSPDAVTEERWLKHTLEFARNELKEHVKEINEFLAGRGNLTKKSQP